MKRISVLVILFFAILQYACNSDGKDTELAKLEDKVMEVHDEVMPEIKYMTKLEKQLKEIKTENAQEKEQIDMMIYNLVEADSLMWDWMHNYKLPKDKSKEETTSYLNEQLKKIQVVNSKMKSSIKNAESKLNITK